ncbi:MAG TPA: hypothetical protein VF582_03755 [Allosphingosinicella sp.]|jgi:hypothetical protein
MTSVDESKRELWAKLQEQHARANVDVEQEPPLKGGGGGGTSRGMDNALIDSKIAASEARTDTKFAKLEGKLDLILERVETVKEQSTDARSEARATRRTVIGTGVSLGALLIAIFTLYTNSFNLGARVDDIARIEARETYNQISAAPTIQQRAEQKALPAPEPKN